MLSMSLVGLSFFPALLFILIILINRFKNDRYDFVIQLTLFFGGYSMITSQQAFINLGLVAFGLSIISIIVLHKAPILKKTLFVIIVYGIALLYFMYHSEESMSVQLLGARVYLAIIYLFVPFVIFSGQDFNLKIFFRHVFVYAFIFCAFYIIDCVIMGGMFFVPNDPSWFKYDVISTFYDPWIHPFSMPRRWPPGLYSLILIVYPAARIYKLKSWHWLLIFGALAVSRTFTFTFALVVAYILCRSNGRKLVISIVGFITVFIALYFIDGALGETSTEMEDGIQTKTSVLRVKSQVDQFIDLNPSKVDEETLAALGTGRGAQIIPKLELLYKLDRVWTGFGFLSRDKTTSNKYIIENDLYQNPEEAIEVASGVESTPFQIVLDIGLAGLIIHVLVLLALWLIVCKLPMSGYFLSVELIFIAIGISGFSGLIRIDGQLMAGLAYAAVILNSKRNLPGFNLPPLRQNEVKPQLK